jgi:hypothetical protein
MAPEVALLQILARLIIIIWAAGTLYSILKWWLRR